MARKRLISTPAEADCFDIFALQSEGNFLSSDRALVGHPGGGGCIHVDVKLHVGVILHVGLNLHVGVTL